MKQVHLQPFYRAIDVGVECVMSSHPYYPRLDPDPNHIATFSRRIIYDFSETNWIMTAWLSVTISKWEPLATFVLLILLLYEPWPPDMTWFWAAMTWWRSKRFTAACLRPIIEIHSLAWVGSQCGSHSENEVQTRQSIWGICWPSQRRCCGCCSHFNSSCASDSGQRKDDSFTQIPSSGYWSYISSFSTFAPKIMIEREFENETSYLHHALGKFGVKKSYLWDLQHRSHRWRHPKCFWVGSEIERDYFLLFRCPFAPRST